MRVDSFYEMFSPLGLALDMMRALLGAVAMSAVIVMLLDWLRRRPFPQQPGEWILVSSGVVHWFAVATTFAGEFMPSFAVDRSTINIVPLLLQAAVLALGGVIASSGRVWAIVLSSSAVALVMSMIALLPLLARDNSVPPSVRTVATFGFMIASAIGLVAFVVAIVNDIRRKEQRGWIHIVALGWLVANVVLQTATEVAW
jgi:hypothetical protein